MQEVNKTWHTRGYIPHFEGGQVPQSITFRLAGSIPVVRLKELDQQLAVLPTEQADLQRHKCIEDYLDRGIGVTWLSHPEIGKLVEQALLSFEGKRYDLHAWVVMPNHVHVLISPAIDHSLSQILHTWKSYTAKQANFVLGKVGSFWQKEYFDRYIRNEEHFLETVRYIEYNPVKAGLCNHPDNWQFSSANKRS